MADEEQGSTRNTNRERRSSSIFKILAGAGGGGFLTFLTWMISQSTDPIIRDQGRLETKIDTVKLELLAAIKDARLENSGQIDKLMQIIRDDRISQWKLDEKQNLQISELNLIVKPSAKYKQKEN